MGCKTEVRGPDGCAPGAEVVLAGLPEVDMIAAKFSLRLFVTVGIIWKVKKYCCHCFRFSNYL